MTRVVVSADEARMLRAFREFVNDPSGHLRDDVPFLQLIGGPVEEEPDPETARRMVFGARWPQTAIAIRGMIYGGLVGDAFTSAARDATPSLPGVPGLGPTTAISRRILLFAAAMVRGRVSLIARNSPIDVMAMVRDTYRRWIAVEAGRPEGAGALNTDPAMLHPHATEQGFLADCQDALARGTFATSDARSSASSVLVHMAPLALMWSPGRKSERLVGFSREVAALTHGSPDETLACGVFAGLIRNTGNHWLGRDVMLLDSGLNDFPDRQRVVSVLQQAFELWRAHPDDPKSGIAALTELADPSTALGALAVGTMAAIYGDAIPAEHRLAEALAISVAHPGDRVASAVVCGQLLGMEHGPGIIPSSWIEQLDLRETASGVVADVIAALGPEPPESDEWCARYADAPSRDAAGGSAENRHPARPRREAGPESAPTEPLAPQERFLGCLLGGAAGDALGYAIEFHDIGMIRHEHGANGLTAPVLRDGVARVSDDTQMMLFTLEGLVRAHIARRIKPVDNDPIPEVQHAYQRWFHTQNQPWEQAGGPYSQHTRVPDGWLITNSALFAERAPGSTCLRALENFARTHRHATPQHRINDSKGCGGVMRAAPVAVWSNDPAEVFGAAVGTAALTHGHPSGFLSAGMLAVIVHQLIREVPLPDAVRMARELLVRWPQHEEQLRALDAAVELARRGPVGEEALAIGLYAVLATNGMREALLLSVNHSGDSDSTGMVCGNIAGALYGPRALPPEWLRTLELRDVIEALAADALVEFSPAAPTDASWTRRYPAW